MLLRIQGHISAFFPGEKTEYRMTLQEPTTVREIVESLGVNPLLVMGVFINGHRQDLDHEVSNEDEVLLLSPTSGG